MNQSPYLKHMNMKTKIVIIREGERGVRVK